LRPALVGRDTQLHELLIFLSTLGGLMFFGASGFILGPVLAALFVTVWDIFAIAFRRELAEPTSIITDPSAPTPLPSAIITDTSAGSSLSTSPRPATPS
jgi:hypothetical protein